MNPIMEKVITILSAQLSAKEFSDFALMIDADGDTGPFWNMVQLKNSEINPNDYNNSGLNKREFGS